MSKNLPKQVPQELMNQAWSQQLAEDWMIQMNIITPEYLQKVRILLMVVFNLSQVDVNCDINKSSMEFEIKFSFWRNLFKSKKKLLSKINTKLAERFPAYDINVRVV